MVVWGLVAGGGDRDFPEPNACDKQHFRVLEFLMEREVRNIQVLVFGCNQKSAVQIGPIYFCFLRALVLPRRNFLFSCANSGHWPDSCGKIRTSVSSFFCWREKA